MLNGGSVEKRWQPMSADRWNFAGVLLQDLHRREHRPLRAADAEARRARRQPAEKLRGFFLQRTYRIHELRRPRKLAMPVKHHLAGVLAGHRQHVLAAHLHVVHAVAPQGGEHLLLDEGGLAFLDDQDLLFPLQNRRSRPGSSGRSRSCSRSARASAEDVGEAERLQRADRRRCTCRPGR
jgi:hypothetical protein